MAPPLPREEGSVERSQSSVDSLYDPSNNDDVWTSVQLSPLYHPEEGIKKSKHMWCMDVVEVWIHPDLCSVWMSVEVCTHRLRIR
jgi:hypothetical protein